MLGSLTNRVFFLSFLGLLFCTFSESCLDGTTQQLISGNRYRVQDQFFDADSDIGIYSPQQARLQGASWCSSYTPLERPWLQVTFGIDVNISIIQTGGIDNDNYVTRFEVHIGSGGEGSFHPLTIADNSTEPMVFVRTKGYNVENTTLPSPVTAQVLRIVPVEWRRSGTPACLRLEVLGCPASPAVCEAEVLLTNENEFLDSIIGSPSFPSDSPSGFTINDLVTTRNAGWCTAEDLGSNPYFQLNFTSELSLAYMEVRGSSGTPGSYVSQFRLEVQDESGDFSAYGITSEPTVFPTSEPSLKRFTFWRPIHGSTFRLHILNVVRNQEQFVCWNVKFYGCLTNTNPTATGYPEAISGASETTPVTPPNEEISEAAPKTTQNSPSEEKISFSTTPVTPPNEEISEETPNATVKIYAESSPGPPIVPILGGVVGGVLGLIMLLAIVVEAIFIFSRRRRRSSKDKFSKSCKDTSEHKFNNSIYGKEIALSSSLYKDPAEHMIINSIYGKESAPPIPSNDAPISTSGEEARVDYRLAKPNFSSSLPPNMFKSFVPSTTAMPMKYRNGTVVSPSEMHYDPVYAQCDAGEINTGYHHLTRPDISSSLSPNAYEVVIPSPTAVPMKHLNGIVVPHEDPVYSQCDAGEINTGYHHLTRPDIPSTLPPNAYEEEGITVVSIKDINGTMDAHHKQVYDLPYVRCDAGELKTGYHQLVRPDTASSNTSAEEPSTITAIYHESASLNGTANSLDDEEMIYNPIYDKSSSSY